MRPSLPGLALVAAGVLGLLAAACSGGDAVAVESEIEDESAAVSELPRPDEHQLIKGPVNANGYRAILGTDDLSPGRHRVGFILISPLGVVKEPTVSATLRAGEPGSAPDAGEAFEANYQPWPIGSRGLHTAYMEFAVAGPHRLDIVIRVDGGGTETVTLSFEVAEATSAPTVGSKAIRSVTKTLADVAGPTELTTGSFYDEDLYRVTLADAIDGDGPVVVVFASPAFCINAVCGSQVDVLSELQEAYAGRASFVHVDLYENPEQIQGDLSNATIATAVREWNLPSNEWIFVIYSEGVITARFEAFATFTEIEQELAKLLS
jgi:hypothetical protein